MPYTPPVGTANLSLRGAYTPPIGTVDLSLALPGDDRTVWIIARTGGARGALFVGSPIQVTVTARTGGARSLLDVAYDPNLLSAVHAVTREQWQPGTRTDHEGLSRWQASGFAWGEGLTQWQPAEALAGGTVVQWQPSGVLNGAGQDQWQEAESTLAATLPRWQGAERAVSFGQDQWQEADALRVSGEHHWRGLPLLTQPRLAHWQDGFRQGHCYRESFRDGRALQAVEIEVWQPAGYPGNAPNPGPSIPPSVPWPWGTHLKLRCPLPGTHLKLGRVPCILIAEREVAVRRSYMSINSASLVRWPDLTPLPCTSMTIETDFDSWCWALSATLAGPDAFGLVQPNPLACEVLATINGQPWKFLLDVPSTNRAFNQDQVTLKGRSRSAWMHTPYTPSTNRSEAAAREMVQLGEAALELTGWTLNWQGENWLVPAGRYTSWNTPIGALMRLAQTTDDGLYTDPDAQIITLQKRWPVASWLIDGEVVDLLIPEAAIISSMQIPLYTPPLNGVYVSGTSHGALALVKIAGTDGALQPSDPIVDELLCDEEGVAARQRGLNALSDSGSGFTMDAETLFIPPTFPLVRPGLIVSIAGMKGVSRSVKISAYWSQGLQVKQSIGLERREVES